jgi:uncharacterized repeat protein (TIGR01451 family)/CSLREA domain-containing protein
MIHQHAFRKSRSLSVSIRLVLALALLVALASVAAPTQVAYAATILTIDVDDVDDNNPLGGCTLREAIDLANAGAVAGKHPNGCGITEKVEALPFPIVYEINLPGYTYTLSGAAGDDLNVSGDLDIAAKVAIVGGGKTTISGGGVDRVFHIDPTGTANAQVHISGVTIRDGYISTAGGGGIFNNGGSVYITGSVLTDNEAETFAGGILSGEGTLVINSSTIFSNTAIGGGGIYVYASASATTAELYDSTIRDNLADDHCGGICVAATNGETVAVTIENSTIRNNHTFFGGGGLYVYAEDSGSAAAVTLAETTIEDNSSGYGGGLYAHADGSDTTITVTLESSVVSHNDARVHGGGFYASNSTLMLNNSTVSDNTCDGYGGGIYMDGIRDVANLNNVTITGNTADDDNIGDGGIGGIGDDDGSTVNIKNTIIAGNHDNSGTGAEDCRVSGTFNSLGYNLVGDGTGCPSTGTGDQTTTDPRLGPLADNGGDTPTHALLSGSPAIDAVADCTDLSGNPVAIDQRGVSRPVDGDGNGTVLCDVGAYEAVPLSISKTVTPTTNVAYHGVVTYTVVLSNSASVNATGILLTDTLPSQVDFASWVIQPSGADESDDEITWDGQVLANNVVTFTFVVTHTGDPGDIVTNTAEYSHTIGSDSAEAAFTVESMNFIYLPLVLRNA